MLAQAFHYKCWADRRTLDAIALIDASRFADSLAFTLQQLNHMVIVEDLFRARLSGVAEPHPATNSQAVPPYAVLRERLLASGQWYAARPRTRPMARSPSASPTARPGA
ncbi:DinB family protein [Metapseudomonas otitidis]|uniref:DinB family protein n=1 Tax=Metapseudomonas otitidis TaxID=319939 RepID=UPI0020968651|nr:DinB family protein [Pseudomonas otitidis]MCO7555636.1 hypothetical protein [Pseudomonas otitidis]